MSDIDDISNRPHEEVEDETMQGAEEDEGEDVEMPPAMDDSSEEESEDEEEARKIREGFIVDEDDDEDEEDEDAEKERKKRQKRRKKRHHREEDEQLEEDDLELLEENTGASFRRNRLTRLRRGRDSESPPAASSSRRKAMVESSDEDLDNDDGRQRGAGIAGLWDDDRRGDDDDEGDMDTDSFIEYSDEEEAAGNEESREERRREKKQDAERRKRARRVRPELAGIDANAWDEIHDVFGDGHEYDWALAGDEDMDQDEEAYKPEMRYQDVFEPTEIRKRMLTEDDDLIRVRDIPERMQLATSSLSQSSSLLLHAPMTEDDLSEAAMWIIQRLPPKKNALFFAEGGQYFHLSHHLVLAVTFVLRSLFIEEYEVPYIWVHKRDYISNFDRETKDRVELLSLPDLWTILHFGYKYRSLLERRKTLSTFYERLQIQDDYFEHDIMPKVDGVEVVADATDWLSMKYKNGKPDAGIELHFHDDEEVQPDKKHKTPSRVSAYELAKKSIVAKLAKGFGVEAQQVVQNFMTASHLHDIEDPELSPLAFADQFVDPDPSRAPSAEQLLDRARLILATELGKDPLLRNAIRKKFKDEALISVEPTERGITKIDEHHPYFNFKYLHRKPIKQMLETAQFLHILAAEADHLVTVSIYLPPAAFGNFEKQLTDAICSDNFNESAKTWNAERTRVVQEVLEQHLIPVAVKWTREYLREEVEDNLAHKCGEELRKRVDVAPYMSRGTAGDGENAPSVLAMSWGRGDPHKDAITMTFLDEAGRMREHTKIDNLHDGEMLDEFFDLLKRRKPDVVAIGGFSIATLKLTHRVKELLKGNPDDAWNNQQAFNIPVVYVKDDIARIYQHSKRSTDEFPAIPPIAKYCVGLGRYIQSPLNEFAALGSDISAITFSDEDQHLISKEKLYSALERVLVDVTNKVGVNINRAVADEYYQHLLPFVCGLGPRKAQAMVKKIVALGGNLNNREQFIKGGVLTTKIFFNASAFLRIVQERENPEFKYQADDETAPDPLDSTRIHLEDYELARKMAIDALEWDEEDITGAHPSWVVNELMSDRDKERKLAELNLDDFAVSLYEANQEDKRHTLGMIRDELLSPFKDDRPPYKLPTGWEVITMLSGETDKSLSVGVIVSASIQRLNNQVVNVKLDSGIEGVISSDYVSDMPGNPREYLKKGQTVVGIVIERKFDWENDTFHVDLSSREKELKDGDIEFRRVRRDEYWNYPLAEKDQELTERRKRRQNDQTRRIIKHPNFQNLNSSQAENYLKNQQRGDVVIRPSSKGSDHLAVTWKVDDDLYQHIDVTEMGTDPTGQGQTVEGKLYVDAQHVYADLDELIVNHVQAMARKVEELMAHEKYKGGSEDELHLFLKNFLAANPAKSMYGFTLNRKRPGHFNLCFLANKKAMVQTWPVRVAPEAYYLFDAQAAGVPELCDAFKVRHAAAATQAAAGGGKTPYASGLRTPGRPLGGATPGHMSVRQPAPHGRTPNPYGHGGPMQPSGYGGPPPPGTYGFQTPSHLPPSSTSHPPMPPGGMPPRPPPMAMHQGANAWGAGNGAAGW